MRFPASNRGYVDSIKSTALCFIICLQDPLSYKPHLEYSDKRLAARAAGFPVAYDSSKRLAVSAV